MQEVTTLGRGKSKKEEGKSTSLPDGEIEEKGDVTATRNKQMISFKIYTE